MLSFITFLGELGKLLGAKWKEMGDDEKKVSPFSSAGVVCCFPQESRDDASKIWGHDNIRVSSHGMNRMAMMY